MANQQLNKSLNQNDKMDTVLIVENNGEFYNLNQFYFRKAGITTVVFKWNYARVFISKQDLKTMGIWISHKIAAGMMATLGVAMQNSPHGIWFDYNYITRSVGAFGFQ
ncbi:MAG: hypothetical protein HDT50_01565 [Lactobacillus sp.]|nr:hypothetical protein [Lactobacillus sp.]